MKKKQWKQLIASLICIVMLVNTIPANAMTASADGKESLATEEIKSSDDGVEIVEKRESNKKYFRMQDGSILAAIYPQDVHYENEQGEWCDVDNSLNAGLDGLNAVYENGNNEVSVKFMKKANKNKLFTLVKDDRKFKVSIEDVEKVRGEVIKDDIELSNGNPYKLDNVNGQITYNGIFENIDIQYTIAAQQLKENIILRDAVDFEKITYQYQYDKDLSVVQKDKQTIVFKKAGSEKIVLEVSAPAMWDAEGYCSDSLRLTVTEVKQGKATIILEWEKEELEGLTYPITLDPVMSFSTDRREIQDTHILAGYPGTNYNATNHIRVRNNGYSLLQFPTPSLESGDKIIEAQLVLCPYGIFDNSLSIYTNENSYNPPLYINAHKILRSWDEETATYNNVAPDSGFYDGTVQSHRIVDGDDGYYTWDITRLANEWTEGYSANYGVLLKYDQPPSDGSMFDSFFCSTNGAYISSSAWPQILYQYINTKGIEDYYSYHTQDLGYGGTGYVNDLTGDLTIINPVVQTGGNLAPISVSLVYNLDAYTIQCYGRCWKINWSQKIEKITSGTYTGLKYCDGDGTKHFFEYKSDTNEYVDEVNQNRKLISDGTSGNLKMIDDSGVTLYFTKNGTLDEWYLTKSEDAYGNYIIVELEPTYMPRVNKIYSSTGNVVDFIYGDWSFLSKIRYYDGETARDVSVEYNNYVAVGNNSIGKLTYPDGTYVQYHYSSGDYNITKVIDIDNSYMQYDYTSGNPRRVMGVSEYSTMQEEGQKIAYSYQPTSTYITDVTNNRKYLYTFERTGTLKSVVDVTTNDGNGYGQYYEYNNGNTEQMKGKDKLTFISKTQKSTVNLFRDHSYENGLNIWPHQAWFHNVGLSSGTVTTGTARLGTKSYQLYRSDDCDAERTLAYDRVWIELGKRYTFSAYVNTKDMVSYGKGASVYVVGEYFEFESEHITETKDEWQRVSVTFIAPITGYASTCLSMQGAKGYVYYDCVQMEAGDLSEYNLLENAGFEGPSGQTAEGWGSYTGENFIVSNEKASGGYALRFNGGPNKDNEYQQVVYTSGSEGDTYVLSAFAKATSVPASGWQFTMLIRFVEWGTVKNTVTIPFNSYTTDWQKVSGVAKAEGAYTAIVFDLLYCGNANEVYFDNAQLIKDVFGNSYTYDEKGNVISTIDLQGKEEYSFKYDGNNQLIQQTNIAGGKYNYTYNKDKKTELDIVSSGGVSSVFTYDAKGNVTDATTVGSGLIAGKYYYIQSQKFLEYFDVENQSITNGTKIKYDKFDKTQHQRWKLIKNADGTYGLSPESAPNMLLSATNATLYDYAYVGLYPEGAATHQKLQFTKHHGNIYRIDFVTAPGYSLDGNADGCYAYGSHEGEYQQFAFILAENIGTEANPSMTSSATYSENGEYTTSIEDNRGNITNYNYNETRGNLLSTQDAKGTTTEYVYDERELLSQVSTVNGDDISSVSYSYDLYKRLSEIRSSSGSRYVFAYDSFGRNHAIFIGTRELVHYAYSNKGLLTAMQYGNGTTVTYNYDELNRQTSTYVNDELRYEYIYDGASRILEVRDSILNARLKYGYDIVGRVVSEKLINSSNLTTTAELNIRYDDSKNRVSGYDVTINSYSKQTDYVYSTDTATPDLVSGVKRNEQNVLTYQYDELLRLKNRTINTTTPYVTNYYYLEGKTSGTTTTLVKRLQNGNDIWEYSYDELGNILSISKNQAVVSSYTYDNLNQLITEVRGTDTYTYSYDNGGNLTEVKKNGSAIKTYGYGDSEWKDLLTAYNNQTFTYDAIGNPLTYRDGMVMTWSDGRKLSTITKGTDSIVYQYDVNGYRRYKVVNGVETEYYWLNGQLEGQKTGTEYLHFLYDEKGTVYGFILKNETTEEYYYYEFNLQGDIIGILDSTGTKVVAYSYGAWGDILSITGSMADTIGQKNPLRYRGYYYDEETGFYYVSSRYYDPEIGRWINADGYVSTGQGVLGSNMFAYCGNNPVNRVDPTGQFWKELWDAFTQTIQQASGYFAVAAGVSQVDTPAPGPADVASGILLLGGVLVCAGIATYTAITAPAPSISIPKAEEKAEAIPTTPPSPTVIYRYGGTNPGNLTPKAKDKYSGLSFSTVPMPGAAVTTIEALNATGVVYAVQDGLTHVSVRPVGATMEDWINAGSGSIWTQAVKSVVVKWDGGY